MKSLCKTVTSSCFRSRNPVLELHSLILQEQVKAINQSRDPDLMAHGMIKTDPFSKEHLCSMNMYYLGIINLFIVSLQNHCILMLGFPKDLIWQNFCHWQRFMSAYWKGS